MRLRDLLLACTVVILAGITAACHPGPVIGSNKQPSVGGTIAGSVTTADRSVALRGRKVTAVNVATGLRYDATTGANGGYTIKVPEGTYRLEVELRSGEKLVKQPEETKINNGDLDAQRHFVITAAP